MATVTQTITSVISSRNWKRPPDPYIGSMPFSELTANGSGTLLALDAADIGVYSFSTVLPRNYAYRLVELRLEFAGTKEADLDNFQRGMEWVITENQVTVKRFLTFNSTAVGNAGVGDAIQARNPSVTNDFVTEQAINNPLGLFTDIIDASGVQSILLGVIVNAAGAATDAVGVVFYARFLSYTIDQLNAGAIWTPSPVVS